MTLFYHPAFDPYFLSYLSPKRVKTVTKGSSRVLMDGAVAPTSSLNSLKEAFVPYSFLSYDFW